MLKRGLIQALYSEKDKDTGCLGNRCRSRAAGGIVWRQKSNKKEVLLELDAAETAALLC